MTDYDNTNKGTLFVNEDKRSQNQPDFKGSATVEIDGELHELWVSGWTREIRNGKNAGKSMISMAFTAKDNNAQQGRQAVASTDAQKFLEKNSSEVEKHRPLSAPTTPPDYDSFDDDIPF